MNTLEVPITPAPPPGVLLADHFVQNADYRTWRPQGTRDWLLTFTMGGAGRYGYSGGNYHCEAGELVLLAPGTAHDYAAATREGWDFFWVHFVPRLHWLPWLALPALAPGLGALAIHNSATHERLVGAFRRMLADSRSTGSYGEELALNALEEILLVAAAQTVAARRELDPRIGVVLERLATTLNSKLDVNALADTVALSPSRLAHLYRSQIGESIGRSHMRLRLRHAARLLEFSARSIAEIATDVGFSSPFHFSHQFKQHYGESPQAYRKRKADQYNRGQGSGFRA